MSKLIVGKFICSESIKQLSILDGFLFIEDGKIKNKGTKSQYEAFKNTIRGFYEEIILSDDQFIIPGFIDCHVHAPQFPNLGLGLDRPLLQWLEKYTFPLEKKYDDTKFARDVYDKVVTRLLKNGTTTACYFGSLHLSGTLELVNSVTRFSQRALVGKVSMNQVNNSQYYNSTDCELQDIQVFLDTVYGLKNDLLQPIITPRFALSCDLDLMKNLGQIAKKYNCNIQSHISENKGEIEAVLAMFPSSESYADVYNQCGLLTNKCILAHGVHLTDKEISTLSSIGVSIAHCPASNTRLMSGLCPVRTLLNADVQVGLGTDVAGGDSASILDAIRRTMDVSSHMQLLGEKSAAISWKEAFYLATLGGAKALNLEHKIGDFSIDKEFDALLINIYCEKSGIDRYDHTVETSETALSECLLQRFIYLGDDRNIERVFVKGNEVKKQLL